MTRTLARLVARLRPNRQPTVRAVGRATPTDVTQHLHWPADQAPATGRHREGTARGLVSTEHLVDPGWSPYDARTRNALHPSGWAPTGQQAATEHTAPIDASLVLDLAADDGPVDDLDGSTARIVGRPRPPQPRHSRDH